MTPEAEPLWSGRFAGSLDPAILDFTASLAVDRRLLPYDLRASAMHVRMLARQGLIEQAPVDRERGREVEDRGIKAAGEAAGPQGLWALRHTSTVSGCVAAAHVLVGSDHTWMKPAAAPCWKLSPSS